MKVFVHYQSKKKVGKMKNKGKLIEGVASVEEAIRKVRKEDESMGFVEFKVVRTSEYPDKIWR